MPIQVDFSILDPAGSDDVEANSNVTFDSARNKSVGDRVNYSDGSDDPNTMRVQTTDSGSTPRWSVSRGFLLFDTTNFPKGSTISSASIRIWPTLVDNNDATSLVLVQTAPASNHGLIAADFSAVAFSSLGSLALASMSTGSYMDIPFSDFSKILAGGISLLGLINSLDLADVAPSHSNAVVFGDGNHAHPPLLRVSYTPPIPGQII